MSLLKRLTRSMTKGASSSRAQPSPSPSPSLPSDSGSEEDLYEKRMAYLRSKEVITTSYIDYEWLTQIGICDEFDRLTARVGFNRRFLQIQNSHQAYRKPTREFLASLSLVDIPNKGRGIQFSLNERVYQLSLRRLRKIFHLPSGQTEYLGYIPEDQVNNEDPISDTVHQRHFWRLLTNEDLLNEPDAKITSIIHPVLRFLMRTIGSTIFARGETTLRPVHRELALIATILRPDEHMQRPDLMLHMVHHWLSIANGHKKGGLITMGSYVTHIANALGIDFGALGFQPCGYGQTMNRQAFSNWHWIQTRHVGQQAIYVWQYPGGQANLPIAFPPIDFYDDHTWRMQIAPAQPQPDAPMEDAFQQAPEAAAEPHQQVPPYWQQQQQQWHDEYIARFERIEQGQIQDRAQAAQDRADAARYHEQQNSIYDLMRTLHEFHFPGSTSGHGGDGGAPQP